MSTSQFWKIVRKHFSLLILFATIFHCQLLIGQPINAVNTDGINGNAVTSFFTPSDNSVNNVVLLSNDDCSGAIALIVGSFCINSSFSSVGATSSAGVPNPTCGFYQGGDVWFSALVPASGNLRVEINGTGGFYAQFAIYTGACASLTQYSCNQLDPTITISDPALALQTIYIRVYNYNSASGGTFNICVWEPPVPANNNCANAILIPTGTSCLMNTYTNAYATADAAGTAPNPSCGFYRGGDVWFKFVVPASGIMRLEFADSPSCIPQYAVYSGSCGSLTQVICLQLNPEYTYIDPALAGQTLYVRVWNYNNKDGGTFSLCVWEPPVPINNSCANAITIPSPGTNCAMNIYTNAYATADPSGTAPNPTCGFYAGGDVWFKFVAPASGKIQFEVVGILGCIPQYAAYTGTCGSFTQVYCGQLNPEHTLVDPALGGQTIYLRIWNYNNEEGGTFRFCVWEPPVPPNDDCANATLLPVGTSCVMTNSTSRYATSQPLSVATNPTCGFYAGGDVWYTVLMPASGNLTIQFANITGNAQFAVYSGTCGSFTQVACAQLATNLNINNPALAGQTLYLRVWDYNSEDGGTYSLCAFNPTPAITITCPSAVIVQCGSAVPAHDFAGGVANGGCGNLNVSWVSDVISNQTCPNRYTITRTYMASDGCSNTATCSQVITVNDNIAPILNCPPNITVQCTSAVPASEFAGGTASDNCGVVNVLWVSDVISNQTCANKFTITRTYSATDACGNVSTCTQIIIVNDNTAPTISCPASVTVQCASAVPAHDFTGGTVSDNCGAPTVAWVSDVISNQTCANKFTITRTYSATDACGNVSTCTQIINVNDNTAPTISCPASVTVQCASAVPAHDFTGGTVSDNCGAATVAWVSDVISNQTCANKFTITRTYSATDACGNSSSCTQVITVNDNTAPVINCPADIVVTNGQCGAIVNFEATATDNCGSATISYDHAPGSFFPVGVTIVTVTATDVCNNISQCTFRVTVSSSTVPCPCNPELNITICTGTTRTIYRGTTSGVGPFGPQSVNLTATVSGGTPDYTYSWSPAAGLSNASISNPVANPAITTTYTLTITDSKGCTRSLSITVKVLPLSSAVCSGNGNNVKFSVCHIPQGNPSNPQNICISANALSTHLTPGNGHNNCYLGPCDQQCFSTSGGQSFAEGLTEKGSNEITSTQAAIFNVFRVEAYPNPSSNDFGIQVMSKSNEPIRIRLIDLSGHVLKVNSFVLKNSAIRLGSELKGGTYFAEVTQGVNRQVIKLVKLN